MIVQHATRADWLLSKRKWIGGSTAGKILGVSDYGSPFSAWADYVYPQEIDSDPVPGTPMDFGLRHERANAEAICAILGAELIDLRAPGSFCATVVLDEMPFMGSTPDFLIRDRDGKKAVLQIKCVDVHKADEWKGNAAPDDYEVQLQHEVLTCQTMPDAPTYGILGAVIGGNRPAIRVREFDQGFAEEWAALAARFWRSVETRTPPPVDASYATKRAALRLAAKRRRDEALVLDAAEWTDLAQERQQMDRVAKAAKARIDEIDSRFILEVGERKTAEIPGVGRMLIIDVDAVQVPAHTKEPYSMVRWYPPKTTPARRSFRR